jgi:rubrerythrin
MKIKELKKMIKDAFIAESDDSQLKNKYDFLDEANEADDMTFIANLEKELAEGLTEEKLDSKTKEIFNSLEDLRAQVDDEKFETLLNNVLTMVKQHMYGDRKLDLEALKNAIEKGDFNAFVEFQRSVTEAKEEEEEIEDKAEEETTDGGEEKSDSIVVDKKIVSLSSLPNDTRKILDSLETLRAQAEEFGDQKFITQVGNTITFFTRDFVVAGDEPTKAKVDEIAFPMWNKIK